MRRRLWWLACALILASLWDAVQAGPTIKKLKDTIEVKAEGETLHYRETSLYSKEAFNRIIKEDFKSILIGSLEKRYNGYATHPEVEFSKEKSTVTVRCLIKGAMYAPQSYDFHWLLKDLPFDLYQFVQRDRELIYEGTIRGIPTIIRLQFPYKPAHCHEHVWPRWR